MALYAFDGTWNAAKDNDDPNHPNTNVFRFYQAYHRTSGTDDYYVAGVGTRYGVLGKVLGGVFGLGELPRLDEAYDHLCKAWAGGDRIVDIVGFSRGAATTLDFCNLIQRRGIRTAGATNVVEPNPKIRFIGVWDVVASFGLANLGDPALNVAHHLSIPRTNLDYCFHALAIDERRPSFLPIRLHGACEVWFRGVHSDIGGGNGNHALNDVTLKWMMSKGKAAGLPISGADIPNVPVPVTATPKPDAKLPIAVRLVGAVDRRHYSISPLDDWTNPPATCPVESPADETVATTLADVGLEVLPLPKLRQVIALWEAAMATAKQREATIDQAKDTLLELFQARVPLIDSDDDLQRGINAAATLVSTAIDGAVQRGFHTVEPFFVNEAIAKLPRLFPLTD
jgi:hypothetical protein